MTETQKKAVPLTKPQAEAKQTITYSMRLEFDEHYFLSRLGNRDPKILNEKYKLFFHEVGHGLQMGHVPGTRDVMYYDISGDKDFKPFFQRASRYLSDR